jgi:MATE family multidrug resistance protein
MAGPIILANLSTPLLGAVDTAVMGHLPDPAYLGGIAVGALIFSYLYWGFGFLRMATTGLAAQAHGARDRPAQAEVFYRAAGLGAVIGLGLVALQTPLAMAAFWLFDTSNAVEALARDYYAARIWSAPATLCNYAVLGWLLGAQKARSALTLQLVLNVTNILLDLAFVIGLGWGAAGAGAASAIAEFITLAAGLWIIRRTLAGLKAPRPSLSRLRDGAAIRRLFALNRDLFIRTACLISVFALITRAGAQMGDVILAANAVLLTFQSFLSFGLDGFAHAAEALVGGALGERNRRALRTVVTTTTQWAVGLAVLYTLVFALAGPWIIAALTDIVAVRAAARQVLPWIIASPLVSVWCFQLDGIFIGATRTGAMRSAMIISLAGFVIALLLLQRSYGNPGLWAAFLLFQVLRSVTLGARYPALERTVPK